MHHLGQREHDWSIYEHDSWVVVVHGYLYVSYLQNMNEHVRSMPYVKNLVWDGTYLLLCATWQQIHLIVRSLPLARLLRASLSLSKMNTKTWCCRRLIRGVQFLTSLLPLELRSYHLFAVHPSSVYAATQSSSGTVVGASNCFGFSPGFVRRTKCFRQLNMFAISAWRWPTSLGFDSTYLLMSLKFLGHALI